ncbi:glutamate synthase domain-containing protein 2 [Roseivirga pacifica]|uniref:Glutamate synthase domain-containing protein 2 n=1 Tax=Roseivirga pacifica TaxID=1267423 RepID=A0A1I0R5Q5_9BACT|nr:FMN-binding glutamate synthase family protein [Roseivirga pacifica]RKQ49073.1 glutamate synthase domain-containing protein 2 [Roseivirga pacifica]SEW35866.1 Glutamate synthase domain-containing protein 2 [Roseivirga pacifica]
MNLNEFFSWFPWWSYVLLVLLIVFLRDIIQKKHTISHNFPIVGHLRYMLERIGPELRQYIVANNREELPFNRSQRSWVYASSKRENNYQGFGTDQDIYAPGHIFINPTMIPYALPEGHPNKQTPSLLPSAKVMGAYNKRKKPFRPKSVINISAMSFGSLSANAISSLNKGAYKAECYHNTGEGGYSPYHMHGADTMLQIGTGYFGVRDDNGDFVMDKLVDLVNQHEAVKAIEIKLSQGAKPGKGGVLPASKITKEIAEIRHIPLGQDVVSPSGHKAFTNMTEMLDFIEAVAKETGLPVGIKSAVGKLDMWEELTDLMLAKGIGPDFITIDGGEGGTGAAPPSFANHVSLPFIFAFTSVYQIFLKKGLTDRVVFIGSGKLGFPSSALMAFALGVDVIQVAREGMLSIGCIQAQVCHTNRCPAGVATQNKWLQAGIDPALKSERFYNYVKTLRKEILEITHACGYEHPSQMTMKDVDISMGDNNYTTTLANVYNYEKAQVPFKSMADLIACPHLGGKKETNTALA